MLLFRMNLNNIQSSKFVTFFFAVTLIKHIFTVLKNEIIMKAVELKMKDLLNGVVVTRTIDLSNIFTGNKPATKENQIVLLNRWIEERGNNQHETLLELISFEVVEK